MAIQNDFGIEHRGLFVSPLGVGSMLMLQPQLFLLFHPVFRSGKCLKPGRVADGLVIRDLLTISNVSQLYCAAEFQLESRFDMLHDLALNLFGNGAFQIQVEAKQECSPTLFHSILNTLIDLVELPTGVVQRVELFHDLVNRKSPRSDNALLFVKPSIQLLSGIASLWSPESPGGLHIYRGFRFHSHSPKGYQVEVFLQLVS